MNGPHQISKRKDEVRVTPADLMAIPRGSHGKLSSHQHQRWPTVPRSLARGEGSVPLYLMEDAATAKICRSQLWQWIRHGAVMSDHRKVTAGLFRARMKETVERLARELHEGEKRSIRLEIARELFESMVLAEEFPEFLTIPAYEKLLILEKKALFAEYNPARTTLLTIQQTFLGPHHRPTPRHSPRWP